MAEQQKQPQNVSLQQVGSSRRNFIKGVAVGSALITTITSKPVWASQCSVSGNLSGNVSHHDETEVCTMSSYSPGGWLNGRASGNAGTNPNLWSYTGVTKSTPLTSLFATTSFTGTVAQALAGGSHGWERQCTCAWLNAALWQRAMDDCQTDTNCQIVNDLAPGFYFPMTTAQVEAIYASGKDEVMMADMEAAQNID
ncbi:twin-arginine translocation signal domain-containing protein [Lacimicrobium sp. SS2-24]|uniref:twin-arginine translocation signal domain-containing protein n=1 Tax=Lacimicrobium sp. SS2-24 TaxID=2005569 RepID=UPI000B4B55C8|nr:twin-arginine translocation signal domain-containing protein [Lacimicrobium sp. SS2-24]